MSQQIVMPALSTSMTEGKLLRWLKREGDLVRKGEVIAEIETDKAVLDLEAFESGRLARILVEEGTEAVPVNEPLALLEQTAAPSAAPVNTASRTDAPSETSDSPSEPPPRVAARDRRLFSSPRARRLARERSLELSKISGTGPNGRIVEADVRGVSSDAPRARASTLPNSLARRTAARRLLEAATTIPHFHLTVDCEIDAVLTERDRLNDGRAHDFRISLNDVLVRACALTLRGFPRVNAMWAEEAIELHPDVDIAVAVATDDGLITPIIRRADQKSLATISQEMRGLVRRARAKKLRPEEYQGGGFTISNLGMYGIREFTAIINPPHSAILAAGVAEPRPVVRNGVLTVRTVMTLTLSCDHRVIDGAEGAQFLRALQTLLANAATLLA